MRDRQRNNSNRDSTQPVVGEGELSIYRGENKVNTKVQGGEAGREKVVKFGREIRQNRSVLGLFY